MERGRYFLGLIIGILVMVAVTVLLNLFAESCWETIDYGWGVYDVTFNGGRFFLYMLAGYWIGSVVTNYIWWQEPVVTITCWAINIIAVIGGFLLTCLGHVIGWILLAFIGSFGLTAMAVVFLAAVALVSIISGVLYPINVIRYARDLY